MDAPSSFAKDSPEGVFLEIHLTPRAGENKVGEVRNGRLRLYVTTAPENGKANGALIDLLARRLKVSKSSLQLVNGLKSKNKRIFIKGLKHTDVLGRLEIMGKND